MHIKINKWRIALVGCSLTHFFIFSLLGLWRHWGYMTSITDLGCFDQAIWMASQGHSLINSSNLSVTMNWLGFHFQPILYVFTPLYQILPNVNWLTLSQSAALSFSALPVFLVAHHITRSDKIALIWALIYLLNPFLLAAGTWDFQPGSLAVFFLCLALLAIEQKRLLLLIVTSIALLACKEHMGLTVAGLGFLYGSVHKNWIVSAGFIITGLMMMILVIGVIMPHYSPTGQHPMLESGPNMRYNWLGDSVPAVIKRLCLDPLAVMQTVFVGMKGWHYIFWLFTPFLFLPLGSLFWVIPSVGDLLANLLSSNPMPRSIFSYHSATIIPLLTVAAIHGLQKLSPFLKIFSAIDILKSILFFNLILAYFFAPLPLPGAANFWQPISTVTSSDKKEAVVKKIIENQSISVQANLGAHFTQRPLIYRFPEKIGEADSVVLRLESPTKRTSPDDPAYIGTLAHHLAMRPTTYLDQVEKLLISKDYEIVYWDDPWLIFSKGQKGTSLNTLKQVRSKIQTLREKWVIQAL